MIRMPFAALVAASLFASACAGAQAASPSPDTPVDEPVLGMCAPDVPDCVDVVVVDSEASLDEARALLGLDEVSLDPAVRVARRGDEHFALTEDYVLDRMTVELDPDADGVYRVTSVVLERFDGPAVVSR
jgi:hypothetical protein